MKRTLATLGLIALASAGTVAALAAEAGPPPETRAWAPREPAGPDQRQPPELRLAAQLAATETLVGIRENQLDAWRDYTSALIDLVRPPAAPSPGDMADGADKAFAREERLARMATERAARAATLVKAIGVLRATLSADQLDRLGSVDIRLGPPPSDRAADWFGTDRRPPAGFGHGPMRQGEVTPPGGIWPGGGPRMDFAPPGAPEIPDKDVQPGTAPRPG